MFGYFMRLILGIGAPDCTLVWHWDDLSNIYATCEAPRDIRRQR